MADIEIDITSAQQEQPDIDVHPIYGLKGDKGERGLTGNGISSITLASTVGLVDTYNINYTDGNKTSFTVTNGEKGEQGEQGIQGIQGEQGIQGIQGKTGATPNITVNASVNNTVGTPSVIVTKTGTDENPIFSLVFQNLKGETGSIDNVTFGDITGQVTDNIALTNAFNSKQDTLISGITIKTINNNSILGSGDLTLDGLPSQTGNEGKFLTTDGADASWAEVQAGANQDINNLTSLGNARLQYSPFAINNGTVQNGSNNTLTYSGSVITCDPCIITTADGRTKVFETATSINVSNQSNGSYSIFKDYETGGLSLVNDFKISNVNPSSAYWLDTSTIPANLKVNSEINNDLVYIGDCTISSGAVKALTNRYFNDSGYLLSKYSKAVIMETYQSGTSWYRVYSDGWCEQGGYYSSSPLSVNTDYQVSLLKSYKNTSYNIITTLRNNNGNAGFVNVDNSKGIAKTYFFMRIVHKSGQACSPLGVFWRTCGYIS